jgi:hypothetical protein
MSKSNQAAAPVAQAKPALSAESFNLTSGFGTQLANADAAFESAINEVATGVARIMGTKPSHQHWELVRDAFTGAYTTARGCKEETSRKRWVAVCAVMEKEFALEKPIKPTEGAQKKAVERENADAKADALVKAAGAATPQAIMEIAGKTPNVSRATVAALGKLAASAANEAQKAASEVARKRANELRETLRESCKKLQVAQLEEVRAFIEQRQASGWAEVKAPVIESDIEDMSTADEGSAS